MTATTCSYCDREAVFIGGRIPGTPDADGDSYCVEHEVNAPGDTTRIAREPHVGDWADHKSGGLDPREVTRVEPDVFNPAEGDPTGVWLHLLTREAGPFPASNYTFRAPQTASAAQ